MPEISTAGPRRPHLISRFKIESFADSQHCYTSLYSSAFDRRRSLHQAIIRLLFIAVAVQSRSKQSGICCSVSSQMWPPSFIKHRLGEQSRDDELRYRRHTRYVSEGNEMDSVRIRFSTTFATLGECGLKPRFVTLLLTSDVLQAAILRL